MLAATHGSAVAATPSQPDLIEAVLGIDPGSRRMGWGIVARDGNAMLRVASGVLAPNPRDALPLRLGHMLRALTEVFDSHQVAAIAVESAFVHTNPRTALVLGHARGIAIGLAASRGIDVHEYTPTKVKRQVVGSGRATKEQVRKMIALQLKLDALPQEDEADALAVALSHLRLGPSLHNRVEMTPARAMYAKAVADARRRRGGRR